MMNKPLIVMSVAAAATTMFSCGDNKNSGSEKETSNPFLVENYDTPFQVPPFDKIKVAHYKPAFEEGIKQKRAEIDAIVNNTEAPTFANTIEALDQSGILLERVATVFFNMNSANTNDDIQKIAKDIAPELSKLGDDTYMNANLFAKVKTIWDNRATLNLDTEQAKILENQYKAFVRSGANLDEAGKEKLRKINERLSILTLEFGENVLKASNDYQLKVTKKEDLAGLPEDLIEMSKDAKEKDTWIFTLQNSSVMPFLQYAENRNLRKEIWEAYQSRNSAGTKYDNSNIIAELASLRGEKATLLGYANHAAYVLEENMAKTPSGVFGLLDQLWKPALEMAKKEEADIKKMMEADGINEEVQPYDWRYYAEKIRKQRFDLDEQVIKPYFSLDNVRNGIFDLCQKLYGLSFTQINNVPIYHEDVTAWEVKESDGKHVGVLYMDMHPRESKRSGAWMTSFREQETVNGERKAPVISIVCNFTPKTANTPSLLTFDEATTFFHEFGHALHGLLSNVKYKSLAGTSVPRDFVELPSQILENWAADPQMMKMYAKHYKTGEAIPDSLITKIQNAGTFDQGFSTVEYLAASYLDMNFHTQNAKIEDVTKFEAEGMKKLGLPQSIIPRYRAGYFQHIFSGGYSSGYYGYIWSGVLDTDAYDVFKSTGDIFNKDKANAFRKNILEKGGTEDPMKLYKDFKGSGPSIDPLLRKRGLKPSNNITPAKG